jgi:uncharacterized protein YeaC (DUF1315 family)
MSNAIETEVTAALDSYPRARALTAQQRAAALERAVLWCSRKGEAMHENDPCFAACEATDAALQKAAEDARHVASMAEITAAYEACC